MCRVSEDGVMVAREIHAWTADAEEKVAKARSSKDEKKEGEEGVVNDEDVEGVDHDEEEDGVNEFETSLDGLVFQIKLKVLEAVDAIVRIVYGDNDPVGIPRVMPPKTPEPEPSREIQQEKNREQEEEMDVAEYESDDEMRMFELMRSLRIARHPRDPVPSSLVLKGKKLK
ncbi:UNVERIFIED_CONTAM: hypothetical protein HDU68_008970 [Siphonaria sp. JEL0065]|nr:hypothetical protein HDU68_008970 [Siphonaria sp. JEL0065]